MTRLSSSSSRLAIEAKLRQAEKDDVQPGSAGGSMRELRGLPVIGGGASGAIPGTDPERALLSAESRAGRSRG
jgi:hypothetical protein